MKKIIRMFAVFTGLACFTSALLLGACKPQEEPPVTHTHTFNTAEWQYDETNHWNPATCEHTSEKGNLAPHTFSGNKCTVCPYEKEEPTKPAVKHTVTFDLNYPGADDPVTQEVEEGKTVEKPADPKRTDFQFNGWTTAAEGGSAFDFSSAIVADTVIYAQWLAEGATLYSVTFDLNYDGAPEAQVVNVEAGSKVARPVVQSRVERLTQTVTHTVFGPEEHGYDFKTESVSDWYRDEDCTQKYDFDAAVNEDTILYAEWGNKTYDFEAELTDLSGKTGYGYSISYNDAGMIRWDTETRNQGAHMGFCVGYLYQYGLSLEFVIHSDRAVDNVTLTARLSAEFHDIYIAPETEDCAESPYGAYEEFWFVVNNERLTYDPIALTGAKGQGESNQRPFTDHVISTTVSLKEGENTIQLFVANSSNFESTVTAVAPMVDCISLTTDATLTWDPVWSNLENYEEHSD